MKLEFIKCGARVLAVTIGVVNALCASSMEDDASVGTKRKRTDHVLENRQNDSNIIRTRSVSQREGQEDNQSNLHNGCKLKRTNNFKHDSNQFIEMLINMSLVESSQEDSQNSEILTRSMSKQNSQEDSQDNSYFIRTGSELARYKAKIAEPSESNIKFMCRVSVKCIDKDNRKDKSGIDNTKKYTQTMLTAEWNTLDELRSSKTLETYALGLKGLRQKLRAMGKKIIENEELTDSQCSDTDVIKGLEEIIKAIDSKSFLEEVKSFYSHMPNRTIKNNTFMKKLKIKLKPFPEMIKKNIEDFKQEGVSLVFDDEDVSPGGLKAYDIGICHEIVKLTKKFLIDSGRNF